MRYFLELSYKGTNYHGWQIQPNVISVQEKINDGLSKLLRTPINIMGAGRTDAGVHASQMFAHFDIENEFDTQLILDRLNNFLPEDIVIYNIFKVHEKAHTRFHATSRSYEYRIYLGRNPFLLDTTWQLYRYQLDVEKMNKAASILLNYTDFKCFSKSNTDVNTYNCDIKEAYWVKTDNMLVFHITADRFLRNMVRAIVGTLINIGLGKNSIEEIVDIIESRDRSEAGFSVPAKGLFLTNIQYPKSKLKNE
ncbi:tRNA pseudouridine(38-40) synthase TruA [Urechidicola croceus]|uniref:tRNA pseudouridine synthase A n=1 Tax=Urechidicola croceus TaxID=1850246 RepID=A0A1D8P760_9FLAO|nr:tRNA pseudouridine(38-40) synthase TruA [Urechidicola croceus]AOW20404.1 tRNA pseudouridine(38-40) synthase TruA [Urechidicola croceus]